MIIMNFNNFLLLLLWRKNIAIIALKIRFVFRDVISGLLLNILEIVDLQDGLMIPNCC